MNLRPIPGVTGPFSRRLAWLIFPLALLLVAQNLWSQDLKIDRPEKYTVKRGDTLWDISGKFLEDPWRWPEIWEINEQVANPHLIYPGDTIYLIFRDGKPVLTLDRGSVKLSPQIRQTRHDEAISAIPLGSVREFFSRTRAVMPKQLKLAPYMVAGPEGHILVGAGETLYARGQFPKGVRIFEIFREGEPYRDPQTGDLIGVRAQAMGMARFHSRAGEVSRLNVLESLSEIGIGDLFLPLEQDQFNPQIFPEIPDTPVTGEIMAVEGGVSQIGTLDVVALNRGHDANLRIGHLLAIMERGQVTRDRVKGGRVQLPDEQAGLLMVFKTYDRMSYALILEADKPLVVGHRVTNLFSQTAYEDYQEQVEQERKYDRKGFFGGLQRLFDPRPGHKERR